MRQVEAGVWQPAAPRRYAIWVVVGVALVHAGLAWYLRAPGMTWGGDDAEFTLLARAIAHGSYVESWSVDGLIHARLPPAYPALLALSNALAGESWNVHVAVSLLCSVASLFVFFAVAREHLGDTIAILATALTAVNAAAVRDAGAVMSEAPFRLILTVALWAASREATTRRLIIIAAVAAAVSALTRSIGISVCAALLVLWLWKRRWGAVATLVVACIPVVLWLTWTVVAPAPGERSLYLHATLTSPADEPEGLVGVLRRVLLNAWEYPRYTMPEALSYFGLSHNPIDNASWLVLAALTLPIGALVVWRRWPLAVLLALAYSTILLLWPWNYARFVSPITSILYVVMLAGAMRLLQRARRAARTAAVGLVCAPFLVGAAQGIRAAAMPLVGCNRADPTTYPSCYAEDTRGLLLLAKDVATSTPPDAIFFTPKEAAFYLHSGRRSVLDASFVGISADSIGGVLRQAGVTYAIVSPIGLDAKDHNALLSRACRQFRLVREYPGDTVLLELDPGSPTDTARTCAAIQQWRDGLPAQWRQNVPRLPLRN